MKTAFALFFVMVLLAACSTSPKPLVIDTPLRTGITKAELRAKFGPPVRVERNAEGGENWIYHFGTQSESPTTFTETTETPFEKTVTYGATYGRSLSYAEAAVKVSAEGVVVAVPPGKVVLP